MKLLKTSLVSIALLTSSYASAEYATLYVDSHYKGGLVATPLVAGYGRTVDQNDSASSVEIVGNLCVLLARDHTYKGAWTFLSNSAPDLRPLGWNDVVSSWAVFDDTWGCNDASIAKLYYDANGGGGKVPVIPNVPNNDLNYFNDKASSVYIPVGMSVTLFEHGGFSGSSITLQGTGSIINLGPLGWNDKVTSFTSNR
ncbi:hypothetical protein [Bowmanella denitrificans]|uniref:hypothetical protein n=1 Tax=Bowmanella denitrificans TaxID=366582 RepID=UPI000C9B7A30|nr:hypothetical protein [Bowmanella denitrificans]